MDKKWILLLLVWLTNAFAQNQTAIFAGGCFWCLEADFDKVPGVVATISGYDGGKLKNPTYNQVSSGKTKYAEAVKVVYNPSKVSYQQLLNHFWKNIDPTAKNAQFCDKGRQYRSAIFYLTPKQKQLALDSLRKVESKFDKVYTEVVPSTNFYKAEEYHQNYYLKHPIKYRFYRLNCGRDARLRQIWK